MISGKITGEEQIDRTASELMLIESSQALWIESIALAARQYVIQRLNTDFPVQASHFDVILIPSPDSVVISVQPNDEVGIFLYEGTAPHVITGDNMPLGGDIFTDHVNHPGTKAMKPQIDQILYEAMSISMVAEML